MPIDNLRERLAPICKRTLRKQVQPYVSYTARKAIVEEFTPSTEEQELSRLVADYLRRPNLKALPEGQRQLISLVLWKLLASSTHAIAGALETMAKRLQGVLDETPEVVDLAEELDEDYESLDETADEWSDQGADAAMRNRDERDAISHEIDELRHFKQLATNIRDNAKGNEVEQRILSLGKRAPNARQALNLLYRKPMIAAADLEQSLGITHPTANALLKDFMRLDILREITGSERYRLYVFETYLNLFLR